MVKTARMELLRALVSECLSAAAQEIFKIVERTVLEYEEEMSCSKWVVDNHRRLLDVAKSHNDDSLQMSATDVNLLASQQQPAASVNISVYTPSEQTEERPNMKSFHPDCSPASERDPCDQEILVALEDDDMQQECDLNKPLKPSKKPFKCPVCFSIFSSKKTMVRHMKKHPESMSSSYQCQFCDRHFCHKSEYIIHTRIHRSSHPLKCKESFDQRRSLLFHRKHTEEKPYQHSSDAGIDLRSVTPASQTEGGLNSRQGENGRGMKTFPLSITPYNKHEFDQESLQPLCLYQIQSVADIDKGSLAAAPVDHIKTEPADPGSPSLSLSDSTTDDQPLLPVNTGPIHLNIDNILLSRPSEKSTKLFVQFEAGTAQKPYKCPCCAKCFSLTKTLIRHLKIHAEDKPYQCQFCGRTFCQKSDLVNHTRIHTGERPYRCQECHKSFAQKGNLVVHMRKHTGEKPYRCQACSCCFGQKSSLECHMQSHT